MRARAAAMSFGIAAGALLFGVTFLLIALAMGIAELLDWPLWAGFLVVAVLLSIVGAIALSSGRKQLRTFSAVPEKTLRHSRRTPNGSRSGCHPSGDEPYPGGARSEADAARGEVDDLTPRHLAQRYLPEYFVDRVVGGMLTLVGLKMAWAQ